MTSPTLPRALTALLDEGEEMIWAGKPSLLLFTAIGWPFLLVGFFWLYLDWHIFSALAQHAMTWGHVLRLIPFWAALLNFIGLVLRWSNTFYAATTRRLMLASGLLGASLRVIDYDKITDLDVTANPLERLFGRGTIRAFTGQPAPSGVSLAGWANYGLQAIDRIQAIKHPYETFRLIKGVAMDIKSDLNYPNEFRPVGNPGYGSRYTPS